MARPIVARGRSVIVKGDGADRREAMMRLIVSPERAPIDEPVAIRLDGVAPGARVTVRARMEGYGNGIWASEAAFTADPDGCVDVTRDAPVMGTYEGVEPMGLFWSMRREPGPDIAF